MMRRLVVSATVVAVAFPVPSAPASETTAGHVLGIETREDALRVLRNPAVGLAGEGPPSYHIAEPAPDLDGDGHADLFISDNEDALSITSDHDFTEARVTVSAVRGLSGEPLWSWTEPYVFGLVVPSNLVNGPVRTYVWLSGFRTRSYVALDASGAERWRVTYLRQGGDPYLGLPLGVMRDATGDGIPDLAVFHLTATGEIVEVLDGADGSLRARVVVPGASWSSILPDVTGDGLDDLVTASNLLGETTVTLAHAHDGSTHWRTTVEGPPAPIVHEAGELDGDGVEDVVLWWPSGRGDENVIPLSGASGRVMWRGHGDFPNWPYASDVDGDGLDDMLTRTVEGGVLTPTGVRYEAYRGLDGTPLYDVGYPAPGSEAYLWFWWPQGDADGDGVQDWSHAMATEHAAEEAVISGRTGQPLRREPGALGLDADLDHDGTQDGLRVSSIPSDDGFASGLRVEIVRGNGRVLWVKDFPVGPSEWFVGPSLVFAHDLDTDGAADMVMPIATWGVNPLVRKQIKGDAEAATTVYVADGPTGAVRWTVS